MPMDGLTIGFAARELNERLLGGRVDKISQPERDTVILLIRANNENCRLLLCASPNNARCHLTGRSFPNPLEPPSLCMLLRKQLMGARLTGIRQVGGDRVVHFDFDAVNELGDHVLRRLILEVMGRHSNLVLVDENDRILEAARHVNQEMSRVRQLQPGLTYEAPPAQDKLCPETLQEDELAGRLAALTDMPLAKALSQSISGLSMQAARELACRVLAPGEDRPTDVAETAARLTAFIRKLPELADARVLTGGDGEVLDVLAFPYLSLDTGSQEPCRSLSEAL